MGNLNKHLANASSSIRHVVINAACMLLEKELSGTSYTDLPERPSRQVVSIVLNEKLPDILDELVIITAYHFLQNKQLQILQVSTEDQKDWLLSQEEDLVTLGLDATVISLTENPLAIAEYMNPYIQEVIEFLFPNYR